MATKVCRLTLLALAMLSLAANHALADPQTGELLKFYQMPLNNGATPYLTGWPTFPALPAPGYGSVTSTAIYPGHDERSTAYATAYTTDPVLGTTPIAWSGVYMADDFADYAGSPITHVRWWGSYMNQFNTTGPHVTKFLISFEHNIPAMTIPGGPTIPSHPDVAHPGNLHQIVDLVPGVAPPPAGKFTEKLVPTPAGPVAPIESLWEYNAELHVNKWFFEQRASQSNLDDVYWIKIVALVDPQTQGTINWGWHNRDWSIPDFLAAKKPDTPDGAEDVIGTVPGVTGAPQPVWHFEDDAVTGEILITPGMSSIMPNVTQQGFVPQNYHAPLDGPTTIDQFSKDLAFELYTRIIPEPASAAMAVCAVLGLAAVGRRRT